MVIFFSLFSCLTSAQVASTLAMCENGPDRPNTGGATSVTALSYAKIEAFFNISD
jgi:hypothetical protein